MMLYLFQVILKRNVLCIWHFVFFAAYQFWVVSHDTFGVNFYLFLCCYLHFFSINLARLYCILFAFYCLSAKTDMANTWHKNQLRQTQLHTFLVSTSCRSGLSCSSHGFNTLFFFPSAPVKFTHKYSYSTIIATGLTAAHYVTQTQAAITRACLCSGF